MTNVQGRRSPRWALWSRMAIPCRDGLDYLVRLRIIQTPWFGIYLHDINEPDDGRWPHDHPWSFMSIVLRGYYVEHYYPGPGGQAWRWHTSQRWDRFSIHRMNRYTAHRIIEAGPKLKTIIITGPRQHNWGFYVDGKWMSWEDYEQSMR